jgi:light-regulated signal transduction histidine kinase (bacteriophytochrome)
MAIQRHDVRRPDGVFEERYWSPINSPMFAGERRIKYIVHRVEEVTDFVLQRGTAPADAPAPEARLHQMEAEIFHSSQKLQHANVKLEAANKELEAFSYSVSHDLRAPLRGVDGYVRILQEDHGDRLDAEGHRLLDVVSGQAKRMGELIDDLLEFSRLGRRPMRCREIDMQELARAVFENLTSAAPERAPRIEIGALPPAMGDVSMVRQVFANLIDNAIKFSQKRPEPLIEVGWSPATPAQAPAEVVYHVKDNGAGFDSRYIHKLFGVFQRLHTDEEFEGTGVGLALVQRVIQRHGGTVWAESAPGAGATFFFTVPPPRGKDA